MSSFKGYCNFLKMYRWLPAYMDRSLCTAFVIWWSLWVTDINIDKPLNMTSCCH